MGFFSTSGRIIIVVLNIIFVILSLLMVGVAVTLRYLEDNILIKDLQDELKSALKTFSSTTQQGIPSAADIEKLNLNEVFGTASTCLIVIGAFVLVISFVGCCGACYKVQILLIISASTIGILLLAQIIFFILLYASPVVKNQVISMLIYSLEKYKGYKGVNLESLLWNAAMVKAGCAVLLNLLMVGFLISFYVNTLASKGGEFKCCGATSYNNFFNHARQWPSLISYGSRGYIMWTPLACCVQSYLTSSDANCAGYPNPSINNQNKGCFQTIWDEVFDSLVMFGILLPIAFALQVLLIFFTIMMYRESKKNKVEQLRV